MLLPRRLRRVQVASPTARQRRQPCPLVCLPAALRHPPLPSPLALPAALQLARLLARLRSPLALPALPVLQHPPPRPHSPLAAHPVPLQLRRMPALRQSRLAAPAVLQLQRPPTHPCSPLAAHPVLQQPSQWALPPALLLSALALGSQPAARQRAGHSCLAQHQQQPRRHRRAQPQHPPSTLVQAPLVHSPPSRLVRSLQPLQPAALHQLRASPLDPPPRQLPARQLSALVQAPPRRPRPAARLHQPLLSGQAHPPAAHLPLRSAPLHQQPPARQRLRPLLLARRRRLRPLVAVAAMAQLVSPLRLACCPSLCAAGAIRRVWQPAIRFPVLVTQPFSLFTSRKVHHDHHFRSCFARFTHMLQT